MDIDWGKGPEGAIGFATKRGVGDTSIWYRRTASGELEYCVDGSSHWMASYQVPDDVVWREEESAAWDGEGLPPVGTVCEWHGPNSDGPNGWVYAESKVIAYTDDGLFVCMQAPSCWPVVQRIDNCEFRPIRTPEQIAQEERRKAIGEMLDIFKSNYEGHPSDGLQALYDAGYRVIAERPTLSREHQIDDLADELGGHPDAVSKRDREMAAYLFDQGYRKQVAP